MQHNKSCKSVPIFKYRKRSSITEKNQGDIKIKVGVCLGVEVGFRLHSERSNRGAA